MSLSTSGPFPMNYHGTGCNAQASISQPEKQACLVDLKEASDSFLSREIESLTHDFDGKTSCPCWANTSVLAGSGYCKVVKHNDDASLTIEHDTGSSHSSPRNGHFSATARSCSSPQAGALLEQLSAAQASACLSDLLVACRTALLTTEPMSFA